MKLLTETMGEDCYVAKNVWNWRFSCHAMDGAVFPHVIYFTYTVLEKNYQGKRYVNWNKQCPRKGDKLTVYYEYANPEKYTVIV